MWVSVFASARELACVNRQSEASPGPQTASVTASDSFSRPLLSLLLQLRLCFAQALCATASLCGCAMVYKMKARSLAKTQRKQRQACVLLVVYQQDLKLQC